MAGYVDSAVALNHQRLLLTPTKRWPRGGGRCRRSRADGVELLGARGLAFEKLIDAAVVLGGEAGGDAARRVERRDAERQALGFTELESHAGGAEEVGERQSITAGLCKHRGDLVTENRDEVRGSNVR